MADPPSPSSPEGYLVVDFPVPPFRGMGSVLASSLGVFFEHLGFVAKVTLVVFAPLEILKNLIFYEAGLQDNIGALIRTDMLFESFFGALVAPALIYGLVTIFRGGEAPGLRESFRWGSRQWARTFGNRWLAGMSIVGGLILLVVPGVIFAIWFALVVPIVAIEGDNQKHVLRRSRALTKGYRGRIFGILVVGGFTFMILAFLLGIPLAFIDHWAIAATVDSTLDVTYRFFTVLALMMYLGIAYGDISVPAPDHTAAS